MTHLHRRSLLAGLAASAHVPSLHANEKDFRAHALRFKDRAMTDPQGN